VAVIAHGVGNDRIFGLAYIIEALLESGYSVLTAHMAGHGQGGEDHFTVENMRSRLDAMVDHARSLSHHGQVTVIGQSMGGAFALDQAIRKHSGDLLVAVSAPVSLGHEMNLGLELKCLLRPSAYRMLLYNGPYDSLPAYKGFKRDRFPVRVPRGVHYLAAFSKALQTLDLQARLADAGTSFPPLLLVHGKQDGVVPVEHARSLADARPDATLHLADRVHHLDPLLNQTVVQTIQDWLARPVPDRSPT